MIFCDKKLKHESTALYIDRIMAKEIQKQYGTRYKIQDG